MSRHVVIALLIACESPGGGGGSGPKVAESGTQKGSAGGFSAQMSAEMAKAGIGGEPITVPTAAGSAASGSAAAGAATDGSAAADGSSADGSSADGSSADGSSADGSAGTAATDRSATDGSAGMAAASGSAASAANGSAGTTASASGSTASAGSASAGTPSAVTPPVKTATAVSAIKAPANRAYAKPAAEVAAIKLELEPNWERDIGEAGTFSLVVKVPNTADTRVFMVRYGYEDENAPIDCDQYRKFLEDRGAMKVSLNRQRGATCYVEGTDQGGLVAYRMLLTYGGKRLMCHGSLYKDAASASLGDLRDKVLLQAKKICETLAL